MPLSGQNSSATHFALPTGDLAKSENLEYNFSQLKIGNMENQANKSHMLWVRLNQDELAMFKDKATNYPSISAMVRQAVTELDTSETKSNDLREMISLYQEYRIELAHATGNLNQLMKRANELMELGTLQPDYLKNILFPYVKKMYGLMMNIRTRLRITTDLLVKNKIL